MPSKLKRPRSRKSIKGRKSGVALFMVMTALALLTVLISELTYTTQLHSRLAFNYVDNIRTFYLAKAGYKISLLRLKIYVAARDFLDQNKQVSEAIGKGIVEEIWSFPFMFPIPELPDLSMTVKDEIKKFHSESSMDGQFTALIQSESTKLNLNNLLVKKVSPEPTASASPTPAASSTASAASGSGSSSTEESKDKEVNFRPLLEETITRLLEQKKESDPEFADVYRNLIAADLVDSLVSYMDKDAPPSNLPDANKMQPKDGPLYSLSELHMVPGFDDQIYNLLTPEFTVYSTPGINVNKAGKSVFKSLFPEMTEEDVDQLLRNRDDPQVGKLFNTEQEFWEAIQKTTVANRIDDYKKKLQTANIKIVTQEQAFRITVRASRGLSTRVLEAYVLIDPKGAGKTSQKSQQPGAPIAGSTDPNQPKDKALNPQQTSTEGSSKKSSGLQLIYWRFL